LLNSLFFIALRSECEESITDNSWAVDKLDEGILVEKGGATRCRHRLDRRKIFVEIFEILLKLRLYKLFV
jgi:hypothetical protein